MGTEQIDRDVTLSELYLRSLSLVRDLQDTTLLPKSPEYRSLHTRCLDNLSLCASKIQKLNIFTEDEELGDLPTTSLKYMSLDYLYGIVLEKTPIDPSKTTHISRLSISKLAVRKYMDFANLLNEYKITDDGIFSELLNKSFPNGPHGQFVLDLDTTTDPRAKVNNSRLLSKYQLKLRELLEISRELKDSGKEDDDDDDDDTRETQVARLQIYLAKAWFAVQGAFEELQLLCGMSPDNKKFLKLSKTSIPSSNLDSRELEELVKSSAIGPTFEKVMEDLDERTKQKEKDDLASTRVDLTDNAYGNSGGKLLGPGGKVNRPFIITDRNSSDILKSVQGTGQKLPTMTVEQLVEKELANSIRSDTVNNLKRDEDEDDSDSDEQIMKQRQWDDFRNSTPRGSGNTMNLG